LVYFISNRLWILPCPLPFISTCLSLVASLLLARFPSGSGREPAKEEKEDAGEKATKEMAMKASRQKKSRRTRRKGEGSGREKAKEEKEDGGGKAEEERAVKVSATWTAKKERTVNASRKPKRSESTRLWRQRTKGQWTWADGRKAGGRGEEAKKERAVNATWRQGREGESEWEGKGREGMDATWRVMEGEEEAGEKAKKARVLDASRQKKTGRGDSEGKEGKGNGRAQAKAEKEDATRFRRQRKKGQWTRARERRGGGRDLEGKEGKGFGRE
jgi:hypothetical protein